MIQYTVFFNEYKIFILSIWLCSLERILIIYFPEETEKVLEGIVLYKKILFLDSSMAEHTAVNRGVVGSSPTRGAT